MSPAADILLGVGITAILALLGWLLASVNKLLVRQAVNVRAVVLDEKTAETLAVKVEVLAAKVETLSSTSAELDRALIDFHATLAQFVRKGDAK